MIWMKNSFGHDEFLMTISRAHWGKKADELSTSLNIRMRILPKNLSILQPEKSSVRSWIHNSNPFYPSFPIFMWTKFPVEELPETLLHGNELNNHKILRISYLFVPFLPASKDCWAHIIAFSRIFFIVMISMATWNTIFFFFFNISSGNSSWQRKIYVTER